MQKRSIDYFNRKLTALQEQIAELEAYKKAAEELKDCLFCVNYTTDMKEMPCRKCTALEQHGINYWQFDKERFDSSGE